MPSCISYVWSTELDASVTALKIDGKKHTDRGFALAPSGVRC